MFYRESDPGAELSSLIKCIWILERDYTAPFPDHEHLWADANGELIISSGSPYYLKTRSGPRVLPPAFVIGPFTRAFDLYSDGATAFVAARFFPWGFYGLSERPMADLVDQIRPADEVFGPEVNALVDRMTDGSHDQRVEIVADFLRARLRDGSRGKTSVASSGARILATKGRTSIRDLAKEFGMPPRRLERLFRTQTGLSPKALSRIVRFNYAKHLVEKDPGISLTELAAEAGYCDQAHFSKTFKEMFGITPATFKTKVVAARALLAAEDSTVAFLQDS